MKTHYDILGVPFGADYETIRAAYRKALKVYHPDLHEGSASAERLSKQIIDAHAVLKDPDQRVLYDEYILHHRQQRRRLFLITLMLTAGLACGGGLVFFQRSLNSEATTVPPSGRLISARASAVAPAGESEHAAKAEAPSATAAPPPGERAALSPNERAALSPNEMSDAGFYVTVAPRPPKDVAGVESPWVTAALPPNESEVLPPRDITEVAAPELPSLKRMEPPLSTVVPSPPAGIAGGENPSAPVAPYPRETQDAASEATLVPTPPGGATEPAHEVAAAANTAPADARQKAAWAEIDQRGNVEEVFKFIQSHPGTPEAALAERRLEQLIETSDDVAGLEAVRAIAAEPIASKLRVRLDRLAILKEIIAEVLPEESVAAQQSEIEPLPVMVPTPEVGSPPEETIDQAAGITPRDPKKHIKKGLALLKAGDHDRAIASFNNAILLDPPNAGYYLHRATAWEAKGDLDNALADYDAAVRLEHTNIATFRARGLLLHRRGEVERALADLDRAIRLSFSDATLYRDRGMIWYEMGRYNRAIADFTHAIQLDPNLASAYVSRGQAFQKKGDPVTAAINFEKAVNRDPAIGKVYRDLFHGGPDKGERKPPQASR